MYDRLSTYVTWGGTIGTDAGTAETWQTGIHLALPDPGSEQTDLPTPTQLATLLNGPISTFHSDGGISLSAGAVLLWAKAALIQPDGTYVDDPVVAERVALSGGAGSTSAASPQDSLVISLFSGTHFGRANYGKLYMPWWSANVLTTTGRINGGVAGLVHTCALLIDGINSWAATTIPPAQVMIMSKEGIGTAKKPLFVKLGDVKDTQRRRRAQIRENYAVEALA